jgi:radical SAM protein with 4Fe4S-binding SPASM domain
MCDHKNIRKYRKIQRLDINIYKKMIDEIARENPKSRVWNIFFGDPFLCPDMDNRIEYAKKKGLKDVVLNTNGALMQKDKAKKMILAGLDAMYVGIDAATEKTYEIIRTGGDFKKAVQNVLNYKDLLSQYGNGKQKLFVQYVVSDENEHEIDKFKRYWKKNGVNIKIRPKISWAGLVEAKNLWSNEEVMRKSCYWLMQTMSICADGRVALCAVDLHCRNECGNIIENSISEIWNNKLRKYRLSQNEKQWNKLPSMCSDCRDWQSGYAEYIEI